MGPILHSSSGILVVEDDRPIRLVMQRLIERMCPGIPIRAAVNGQDALALCEHASPALILADVMMPVMDGITFVTALRARGFSCPMILTSANEQFKEEALRAGANVFLSKAEIFSALPLVLEQLLPSAS